MMLRSPQLPLEMSIAWFFSCSNWMKSKETHLAHIFLLIFKTKLFHVSFDLIIFLLIVISYMSHFASVLNESSLIDFGPFLLCMINLYFILILPWICNSSLFCVIIKYDWHSLYFILQFIHGIIQHIWHIGCPEVKKNGQWDADTLGQNLSARYKMRKQENWSDFWSIYLKP